MANHKLKSFTIGQFAALHKISKKTLMWYDEIGLFCPAFVGENGYRYYTYNQSATLDTILLLRELNVSTAAIRSFIKKRSAEQLDKLFEEKIEEVDKTIEHLKEIRKTMKSQRVQIKELMEIDPTTICVAEREEKAMFVSRIDSHKSYEQESQRVFIKTRQEQIYREYETVYGAMISVENLMAGNFDDYSAIFLQSPSIAMDERRTTRPAGKYLCAYCKGNWNNLPNRYREILAYAEEHQIELTGYSYETSLNDLVINSEDEYLTRIEIQIKEN